MDWTKDQCSPFQISAGEPKTVSIHEFMNIFALFTLERVNPTNAVQLHRDWTAFILLGFMDNWKVIGWVDFQ
ncbi:hypothetical protein [Desulfosporosinus sp. OT]|uniref:hypothetical protein n=1 Tax=Desulfosporosinus sp. OT TaxID=913865 RepID=UPI00058F26AB|nr:hypothetical protein [Desulfosporosinus sp. OT]